MRRREFAAILSAAAAWPIFAHGQQAGRTYRIGYLSGERMAASAAKARRAALVRGLVEAGFVEGRNLAIEDRFADADLARLPRLAAELARLEPAVIVAAGTPAALAAKSATRRVPIVFAVGSDPIAVGLVDRLARPGGNVTGMTTTTSELNGKQFELLREMIPGLSRVANLYNPDDRSNVIGPSRLADLATALGLSLSRFEFRSAADLEPAFAAMVRERIGALHVMDGQVQSAYAREIVELAARHRIPAIYQRPRYVREGGLVSYSDDLIDQNYRAASQVAKILKGAKPADIPVEQATKFELLINLKTAKALGLSIPPALLARADEVIE